MITDMMVDRRLPRPAVSVQQMAGTLDGYVSSSKSTPVCIATSQPIIDRESTFVGAIYKATSIAQAQEAIRYHTDVVHGRKPASHQIAAWRCMVLKPDRTGLQGADDDFEVKSGSQDDGENHGGENGAEDHGE